MPPGSEARSSKRRAVAGRADRLSALRDTALQRVLYFLPSTEAVQTCLLARRWRYVWKSVQALRVTNANRFRSANDLNMFINSLLILREPLPLHVVEVGSHRNGDENTDEALQYMELWIRCALSCGARVLCVYSNYRHHRWTLPNGLITSKNLMALDLYHVDLQSSPLLDFSSCPALVYLRMKLCYFQASMIISPSAKHLSITGSIFDIRTRISVPNLIFLELADCYGWTPLLENMPLLASTFVRLPEYVDCEKNHETGDGDCGSCEGCCGITTSLFLEALSGSTHLELTSPARGFTFRKDLTRCPVFSKLKTLLLSEWCMTANLDALICFLQHSPVLEKLTLQFPKTLEDLVGTAANCGTAKEAFSLERLTVEVKCHNVDDEGIHRILDLLNFYGVPSEQIKIQQLSRSLSFSFEQKT